MGEKETESNDKEWKEGEMNHPLGDRVASGKTTGTHQYSYYLDPAPLAPLDH